MDKNTKNSVLFGAVVGGLYALARGAGNKQKLTDGQLKDINSLQASFDKLKNVLSSHVSMVPVYEEVKKRDKQYREIRDYLEDEINENISQLSVSDIFTDKLEHVLSERFAGEKGNDKTHEIQSFFANLSNFPKVINSLLRKRIEMLQLLKKISNYLETDKVTDCKPEDVQLMQTLVSEFRIFEKQASDKLAQLPVIKK